MKTLFIIGLVLIAFFGFAISAYLTAYKLKLQNILLKGIAFLLVGISVSVLTFVVSLAIVWPSLM